MTEYYGIPTLTNRGFRFDQILFKATQEGYSYNGWTNESTKNDKWNPADGKEVSFQAKFTDYVRITENTGGAKSAVYVHYKRLNTYERAGWDWMATLFSSRFSYTNDHLRSVQFSLSHE